MKNPGSRPITFNYTVAFFFSAYISHIECLYIIEYFLGTSQVNEYRARKKKLWIVCTSILEKTLPHIDNFRKTLLCDS